MSTVSVPTPTVTEAAARLPCVGFSPGLPGLQVHFTESGGVAAVQAGPPTEVYDAGGFALTWETDRFGLQKLRTTGDADPAAVLARVVSVLRASAGPGAGVDEEDASAIELIASWIATAPDLEHALHALALAEVVFTEPEGFATLRCISCNPTQRFVRGTPPCCPKT